MRPAPELPGAPGGTPVFYPGGEPSGVGVFSLLLEIGPTAGPPWIGVFAGEDVGLTRVIALPDGESLAVVCGGVGCIVHPGDPRRRDNIPVFPVREAVVVSDQRLVVFGDFTDLVCYGADGLAWESGRLVLDGLEIVAVEGGHLRVSGLGDPAGDRGQCAVDLSTGSPDRRLYP